MITESLINFFFDFLFWIFDLLPSFSFDFLDMSAAYAQISGWISWANYYLPMDTLFGCAISVFSCWLISSIFSVVIQLF